MPGLDEANGPSYISSHSADIILSEIRPIKIRLDALRSLNVLLDEFLYNILNTASSLHTDKLRASLLSLLPTSLGKEALLEAEVELRVYWERIGSASASSSPDNDDSHSFSLQWGFELLRLKCEAYATLNESDEDPVAEKRLHERLGQSTGAAPPSPALVAPAALYLTAILEAVCEHILSNVGRVASRDSSRTNATVQDLFTALCEDDSIYSLFKSMKVYEQIELLSKTPKPRRSKSFSRGDKQTHSRTSSPHQDQSTTKDISQTSTFPRTRLSSEASMASTVTAVPLTTAGSRSSFEKSRAMKMFKANSRVSGEREGDSSLHKRSESMVTDETRGTLTGDAQSFEDPAMLREFDDLMRSDSTMKVSLTPDRLKTMEVYKQEKDQRGNRRPTPLAFKLDSDSSTPPLPPRSSGLRHVDSIIEDEEDPVKPDALPLPRQRQASISAAPNTSLPASSTRTRSLSNPGRSSPRSLIRKSSRTSGLAISSADMPSAMSAVPPAPSALSSVKLQNRERAGVQSQNSSFPLKTRKIQRNRESLDLDDVMGGSDEEPIDIAPPIHSVPLQAKAPTSPRVQGRTGVSSSTRDLMDFLAEGPPETPLSKGGDFLGNGANSSVISIESGRTKSSGRLQRMMSKLTMGGNSEKGRNSAQEDIFRGTSQKTSTSQSLPYKTSAGNLSSLANRPIPPRPPPISPPSSPSSDEKNFSTPRSHVSTPQRNGKPSVSDVYASPHKQSPEVTDIRQGSLPSMNGYTKIGKDEVTQGSRRISIHNNGPDVSQAQLPNEPLPSSITRKPVPAQLPTQGPQLSQVAAQDMHRLFARATTVDECRLIFDMFCAKSGIPIQPREYEVPYPSPSLSIVASNPADNALEQSLVELLLGGTPVQATVRRRRTRKPVPSLRNLPADDQQLPQSAVVPPIPAISSPPRATEVSY